MPVISEAAAQARLMAKRGANVAAVMIGASFHPFRTVREGASVVRGLVNPPESPVPPAPTDAQEKSAAAPGPGTSTAPSKTPSTAPSKTPSKTPSESGSTTADKAGTTTAEKPAKKAAQKTAKKPAKKTAPGPSTVAKPAAPPSTADGASPDAPDRPVQARGPVPHMPPRIAGEVERDYGDDLPGISPREE